MLPLRKDLKTFRADIVRLEACMKLVTDADETEYISWLEARCRTSTLMMLVY